MLTAHNLAHTHSYGPAHFGLPSLYLMTSDRPDTMASPPPSQDEIETHPHASAAPLRDTQPPHSDDAEAERSMRVMIPAPGATPRELAIAADSVLLQAIKEVSRAARVMVEEREERRVANSAQLDMQNQILVEVRSAARTSDQNFETIRLSIKSLAESDRRQNERLAEGDQRFAAIERSIADLKDELIALITRATADAAQRIDALELQLAAAKATRDPAPSTT